MKLGDSLKLHARCWTNRTCENLWTAASDVKFPAAEVGAVKDFHEAHLERGASGLPAVSPAEAGGREKKTGSRPVPGTGAQYATTFVKSSIKCDSPSPPKWG